MFEIGKTYQVRDIDSPLKGELTITDKVDEQGTIWECQMELRSNSFDLVSKQRVIQGMGLSVLFRRFTDYWETDEGYVQLWFNRTGYPQTTIYKQVHNADDILIATNVTIKYVDNLDLVERLNEKLNQKSLPSGNQ